MKTVFIPAAMLAVCLAAPQPAAARPAVTNAIGCLWQALPQDRRDSFLAQPMGPANSGYFTHAEQDAALAKCAVRQEDMADVGGAFAAFLQQSRAEADFARKGVTAEQLDTAWKRLDPAKPVAMAVAVRQGNTALAFQIRDELAQSLRAMLPVPSDGEYDLLAYLASRSMRAYYEQIAEP